MMESVANPAWQKQAISKAIRVVRSKPKTVRSVCEKLARAFDTLPSRPSPLCHLMHHVAGHKVDVKGLVASIPLDFTYPGGTVGCPSDPLALPNKCVRQRLFKDLEGMGEKIGASMPHLPRYLPRTLWSETRASYKDVKQFLECVSPAMYIPCVDKGTRFLWAFCLHRFGG